MELQKQVCSLELAKRLKELEVEQDGHFVWGLTQFKKPQWLVFEAGRCWLEEQYSAFTVAELGEMFGGKNFAVGIDPDKCWCEWYAAHGPMSQFADSLANAAAKMLIYLIENKLIQPPDILKGV